MHRLVTEDRYWIAGVVLLGELLLDGRRVMLFLSDGDKIVYSCDGTGCPVAAGRERFSAL